MIIFPEQIYIRCKIKLNYWIFTIGQVGHNVQMNDCRR